MFRYETQLGTVVSNRPMIHSRVMHCLALSRRGVARSGFLVGGTFWKVS